jgi:hypothetical protein
LGLDYGAAVKTRKMTMAEIMKHRRRIEADPVWRANAARVIKDLAEDGRPLKGRRL